MTCALGFFCAWKSISIGVLIYVIFLAINVLLQLIGAIMCWVSAGWLFGAGLVGWGILLIIYSLVDLALAAFMAYMAWIGWQLFQELGGMDSVSGGGKKKESAPHSGGGDA